MRATDLDTAIDCPVCGGTGDDPVQYTRDDGGSTTYRHVRNVTGERYYDGTPEACRRCDGGGTVNRYGPNDPSSTWGDIPVFVEGVVDDVFDTVILREWVGANGALHVEEMPISADVGGFDGRYGDAVPTDVTVEPIAHFDPDTHDRLQNQLGTNSGLYGTPELPYATDATIDDGGSQMIEHPSNPGTLQKEAAQPVEASDLPGGSWPTDPNLTADEAIAWVRARGDEHTATVLEALKTEQGL